MKVLFVITQSSWGGAQTYVFDLASQLSRQNGIAVSVAGGQESQGLLAERLASKKIEFIPLKHLIRSINPISDLLAVFELRKLIDRTKPDIIHLNSSKAGAVGSIAARLASHSAKIIYTAHGWVFNESLNPLTKTAYLLIELATGRLKNRIICLSEYDRRAGLKKHIAAPEKIVVIRNGVNLPPDYFFSRDEARRRLNLDDDGLVTIGCIANFYPNKGLKYLIEALSAINKSGTRAKAVIIGDGQLRTELESQISGFNLQGQVLLAGSLPSAGRYLKAFDLAAIPSIKEGVPYFLLEAMSAGLPVAATKVGGMPEIIDEGKTGLLADANNAQRLAQIIMRLIDDENGIRKAYGQAGADKVAKEFSQESMVNRTLDIYRS